MESRFGADFRSVRIHHGEHAVESAETYRANAFTAGNDIFFARGRYAPETQPGRRLLAHELTHVIQRPGEVHFDRETVEAKDEFEKEAGEVAKVVGEAQSEEKVTGGVPQEIMDHLRLREGWRDDVYLDSLDLPTVGLGHLLTAAENAQYKVGDRVPAGILEAWAQADAQSAYDAATSQAASVGVSDARLVNALTYVNFQLGVGWNKKHVKTWTYLLAHEWEKAALEAQDSLWYEQTPVRVRDFQEALRALGGAPAPATVSVSVEKPKFKIGAPAGRATVTATSLNVRKGPGTQFEKNGETLSKGTAVTTYGEIDGWHCIGTDRWISGRFVVLGAGTPESDAARKKKVDDYLLDVARNTWDAMFGGTGIGTDEEKVYANLARLGRHRILIERFMDLYQATYGTDVVADLRSEFSDTPLSDELTRALGYLSIAATAAPPKKVPAPSVGKVATGNRPPRPSDPATQMAALLGAAKTSAKPAGYCYRAIKKAIHRAGGYGDILNIYADGRFANYQGAAINFTAAVNANGAANLGLREVAGLPANAAPGTLLVIQGNGQQRLSQVYGDISVIEGVQDQLLVCYNDGRMRLPADAATWESGRYSGVLLGMYQPIARR